MELPSVNLIRAFKGPRHARLGNIWKRYRGRHSFQLNVFENTDNKLSHAAALNEIWRKERQRSNRYTILTEYDFLPGPGFMSIEETPIVAAEYCTRDPETKKLERRGIPGAWFIFIDKEWTPPLDFSACGKFNDPANGIAAELIHTEDCYPRHYGVRVGDKGEHLFFSRHYNDPPETVAAGFRIGDIQEKVDDAIKEYWKQL